MESLVFFSCDHDVIKIGPEPCLQTLSGGVAVPVCAKNPACSAFTTTQEGLGMRLVTAYIEELQCTNAEVASTHNSNPRTQRGVQYSTNVRGSKFL